MGSQTDNADALFWKAYGNFIKKQAGSDVGETSAFYLATKAQRGPPAGDNIAAAYTNNGIFNVANNLLPADNLFYNPSNMNGYIDQLQTYLDWVDIGGNPDSAHIAQVTKTRDAMNAAREGKNLAQKDARADYDAAKETGESGTLSFAQWAPANAPAYLAATSEYEAKTAAYQRAFSLAYGPQAATKQKDEGKLAAATNTLVAQPGFNMLTTGESPPSIAEIENAKVARKDIPAPADVSFRPAFSSDYKGFVQEAQDNASSTAEAKIKFAFGAENGRDVSESEFNKSSVSGGVSFSYVPWFTFSANAASSSESQRLSTEKFMQDIQVTVTCDKIQLVPLRPGQWDLGDVRTKYKGLLPGAPTNIKTLVRPTQLLLASRLGYRIKVGSSLATTVDTMTKTATSGGGSLSIFGIPCSFSASVSKESEEHTHRATWDSANQEMIVAPDVDAGFATIVGVMGEKINVSA